MKRNDHQQSAKEKFTILSSWLKITQGGSKEIVDLTFNFSCRISFAKSAIIKITQGGEKNQKLFDIDFCLFFFC